jgi:hypothetical protein
VVAGWQQLDSQPSGAWRVEAGSDLAGDDAAIHPYPVSSAARTAISAAVSHAGCRRDSLFLWTGPEHVTARLHTYGQRVSGAEHPDTLTARHNLAYWTGEAGDAAGARDRSAALLPIRERVLAPEHPDTLATRNKLAHWTGKVAESTE